MDIQSRQRALALEQSFIVQAPAGSGKTELLIQRYLALLGQAHKEPEEIVAITFTQKAALEMKDRVLMALTQPEAGRTAPLVQAVLEQNQKNNWHLLENPNRLQIQTIDALAHRLVSRYPHQSRLGGVEAITEHPFSFYRKAARQVLSSLESDPPWASELKTLLTHLHNQWETAESLLTQLLARREQWLPLVMSLKGKMERREELERNLARMNKECWEEVKQRLPEYLLNEMIELCKYSKREITELFLTQDLSWRSQVTEREGFPSMQNTKDRTEKALRSERKQAFKNVVTILAQLPDMRERFIELKMLPTSHYREHEWQLIEALLALLPIAVAHLMVIFKEHAVLDFTEVHLAAERILENEAGPSQICLALDYQIRHILVDEFQDTSFSQGRLLERLTAGWQTGDGRTLFLVGDPMQSIYRFRQAEVGLFLDIQSRRRWGQIEIEPLVLTQNFRASPELIEWNNRVFETLFSKEPNPSLGAVAFAPSYCQKDAVGFSFAKNVSPLLFPHKEEEAEHIVQTIQSIQTEFPEETIAVLVRARTHLTSILPRLNQAGINYQATEIESLASCRVVQDLLALTSALLALADSTAWLSILRAPWCRLTLPDCWVITQHAPKGILWEALLQFETFENLSESGRHNLKRIVPILQRTIRERGRAPLRAWVETTWIELGGPTCLLSPYELKQADAYFNHLEQLDWNAHDTRLSALKNSLQALFAEPYLDVHSPCHVMTIHRAKGLEFDHVILPSLEKRIAPNDPALILWTEQKTATGTYHLILGTLKQKGDEADSIYTYLQFLEAQKNAHEAKRLLYVAMTRAKKTLHLSATVPPPQDEKPWAPLDGSFLAMLWPWVNHG